ncbi:acyltransferase family protein [Bacillus sp. LS15-K4]|nr:acyltransferase family protein [Bacillus sp. LS15-K4]MDJ1474770.1 acyltransferase family protein [Bacillus sp. LS15-K4]
MRTPAINNSRIQAIDIVRGITISLVVMGHTEIPLQLNSIFAAFRMPLFFMVSGYLLNITKHANNFGHFVKSRIWRLLIPYFSACIAFYFIWLLRQNIGTSDNISFYEPILGILYGNGEQLYVNVPLWFLVCLFCSEIIFFSYYEVYAKL